MTHLNTIIEEEVETYKNDYAQAITDVGGFGLAKHIERFLTTAMQRAVEYERARIRESFDDWFKNGTEDVEEWAGRVIK